MNRRDLIGGLSGLAMMLGMRASLGCDSSTAKSDGGRRAPSPPPRPPTCQEIANSAALSRVRTHLRVAQDFAQIASLAKSLWDNREKIMAIIDGIKDGEWDRFKGVLEGMMVGLVQEWATDYVEQQLTAKQRKQFRALLAVGRCASDLPECIIDWMWKMAIKAAEDHFDVNMKKIESAVGKFSHVSAELDAALARDDIAAVVDSVNEAVQALEGLLVVVRLSDRVFTAALRSKLDQISDDQFDALFYKQHHRNVLALSEEIEADINALANLESVCDGDSLCGASTPPDGISEAAWTEYECVSRKDRKDADKTCHPAKDYATDAQRKSGQGCPGSWVECCSPEYRDGPKQWTIGP